MNYSDAMFNDCGKWIKEQLENHASWEEIEQLCVNSDEFDAKLAELIDLEMWPDGLTRESWIEYVHYYKELHPLLELSSGEVVVGIDENGQNNEYSVPQGVASAWEQYKHSLYDSLSPESVLETERSCHWILNHLRDDTISFGPIKGLVTGSVQSGKTANMVGLISMAADYEWNFFIILSGTIDNLRKQTRDRFKRDLKSSEGILWQVLDFTGDDRRFRESELNLNTYGQRTFPRRYVTVCLKNKKRLESLIDWLYEDEKRTQKLRIIVIDDEADQASINTAEITLEEEQDRVAINQLIVNLVNGKKADGSTPRVSFQAMNYVSYTATPYANVLNELPGESLYPKDFICTLPESREYFGTKVIFGNDEKNMPGLGIVRNIPREEEKTIKNIQKGIRTGFPQSFKDAVSWFLCSSAYLRRMNRPTRKNISMLIHTTSAQNPHFNTYDALKRWLSKTEEVMLNCERVYEEERDKVTVEDLRAANPDYPFLDTVEEHFLDFYEIRSELMILLTDVRSILLDDDKQFQYGEGIHICVDNCRAKKEAEEGTTLRIVYPSDEQLRSMQKDPVFIVIGGNTLSRGLTIEGLICSFFSRNSNQADTLMQMARWFGYRKGVELLQRIWMTSPLQEKYEALTKIETDMKEEIEVFMERGISPSQYGPRIRNIPEIKSFRVTSKKKSQMAEYDDFDFRGDSYETTDFDDDVHLDTNIEITTDFIHKIAETSEARYSDVVKAVVWRDVDYTLVRNQLINKYYFSPNSSASLQINIKLFVQWMDKLQTEGKYSKWNIALIDGANKTVLWEPTSGVKVGLIERTRKEEKDHIDIGSLRSGPDALADVDVPRLNDEQNDLLKHTKKNHISARSKLGLDDIPLVLIYRIKKDGGEPKRGRIKLCAHEDIIGISIIVSGDGIGGNHAKSLRISIPENVEEND